MTDCSHPRLARLDRLRRAVEQAAHLLPVQGPIGVFVHHNTLHAFEHLSFEEAVIQAAQLFDAEPYMSEAAYRAELVSGADSTRRCRCRARPGTRFAHLRAPKSGLAAQSHDYTWGQGIRWRNDYLAHRTGRSRQGLSPPGIARTLRCLLCACRGS